MYLSRLILNPRNRRVQREVAHPYEMHRSLMRAFPDDLKEGQERVLYRLEDSRQGGGLILLVQSWTLPDWSWLAEPEAGGYLLPVGEPNPAVKPFDLNLAAGQVLAFRLRANPTAKRKFPSGDHKRVGLYLDEDLQAWLERKAERGGFRLHSVQSTKRNDAGGTVPGQDRKRHPLKMASVQFDGVLQVMDPESMQQTVREGIGSGKGFGFGLLSLAPVAT